MTLAAERFHPEAMRLRYREERIAGILDEDRRQRARTRMME
jgi:hypothetical protein